jgi:hypothetical protein
MSTIVTRSGKGSPLTHNEVDTNFSNLNTDKIQSGNTVAALTITSASVVDLAVTGTTSFDGAQGTAGQVLTSAGAGATPTWTTPSGGGGSGTVTSITAGSGLSGGTITTSGTIALDINSLASTTVVANDLVPVYDVSASANADCLASDIAGLGVGSIGYKNNNYYFPYQTNSGGDVSRLTTTRIYYVAFFVRKKTTFTRIGIEISTAAGTSARLGIYNAANGVPTSLLLDCGTISAATTGEKEATISQSLNTGFYFLALVCDANPIIAIVSTTDTVTGYPIGQSGRYTTNFAFIAANGSITLPNPAQTSLSEIALNIPGISMRVV